MKRLLMILLLALPLTVGALPTVFTEVTGLRWNAPTENTDGSPLADLAGYKLYWSSTDGNFTDANSYLVDDPAALTAPLGVLNLPDGQFFVTITAVNTGGLESDFAQAVTAKKLGTKHYLELNAGNVPAAPSNLMFE